jgi:hypothetical protein
LSLVDRLSHRWPGGRERIARRIVAQTPSSVRLTAQEPKVSRRQRTARAIGGGKLLDPELIEGSSSRNQFAEPAKIKPGLLKANAALGRRFNRNLFAALSQLGSGRHFQTPLAVKSQWLQAIISPAPVFIDRPRFREKWKVSMPTAPAVG